MSDNDGLVYLINTTSDASAGWYDPDVARVLLTESTNWEKADTSNLAEHSGQQETADTDEDDADPPTS